jgi:tRNA/rRNA methyltransferase
MARVRVVLVRPETSANVGACARVVSNTGCAGLDLVDPGDFRTVECWRTAWGAHEVLEQARVFPDLAQALEGVVLAVALTGRHPAGAPVADVRDAATEIEALGRESGAALVFGPETNGLTNDEIGLCGRAATIPADPGQPSYNLSHAVAIAAYEVRRAGWRDGARARARARARATHDQKERLLELLEAGLVATDALPRANRSSYFAEWRALVQRMDLTPKELKLLEHMARKMKRAGAA